MTTLARKTLVLVGFTVLLGPVGLLPSGAHAGSTPTPTATATPQPVPTECLGFPFCQCDDVIPIQGCGFGLCPAGSTCTTQGAICGCVPDPTPTATPRPADHLVSLKARPARGDGVRHMLPVRFRIGLDDAALDTALGDDPENYEVRKTEALLVPAMKNEEPGPHRPELHYLRYQLRRSPEGIGPALPGGDFPPTARPHRRRWHVTNQFGSLVVDSRRVTALLVPTAEAPPAEPPPAPLAGDDTHYRCYRIRIAAEPSEQAPNGKLRTVAAFLREGSFDDCAADPFIAGRNPALAGTCLYDLRKALELCNPVAKRDVVPPRVTSAPSGMLSTPSTPESLLCYKAKLARRVRGPEAAALLGVAVGSKINPPQTRHQKVSGVHTAPSNQFPAPLRVDTKSATAVCVPTTILDVTLP